MLHVNNIIKSYLRFTLKVNLKGKRRVCRKEKALSRQAQVAKYGFHHFTPPLLNMRVVLHRATAIHIRLLRKWLLIIVILDEDGLNLIL